jgi:hypothetical protein
MLDYSLFSHEFGKYQDVRTCFLKPAMTDNDNNSGNFIKRSCKYVAAFDDSDEFMSDDYVYHDYYHDRYSSDINDDYHYGSDINSDCEKHL